MRGQIVGLLGEGDSVKKESLAFNVRLASVSREFQSQECIFETFRQDCYSMYSFDILPIVLMSSLSCDSTTCIKSSFCKTDSDHLLATLEVDSA